MGLKLGELKTCWREIIFSELIRNDESWYDVVYCTLTEEQLDKVFDDRSGCAEGEAFTVWTKNRVYFPTQYDGAESCASVSRNPDGKPTDHI